MQPMPILMLFLGWNPFRPAHIVQYELPMEVKPQGHLGPSHMKF